MRSLGQKGQERKEEKMRVRTTIYLDEDVYLEFKKFCVDEKKTLSNAVQEAVILLMNSKGRV